MRKFTKLMLCLAVVFLSAGIMMGQGVRKSASATQRVTQSSTLTTSNISNVDEIAAQKEAYMATQPELYQMDKPRKEAFNQNAVVTVKPGPSPTDADFLLEDFSSGSYATNGWTVGSTNWTVYATVGNPAPSSRFYYYPTITNYSIPMTSAVYNTSAAATLLFAYDILLDDWGGSLEQMAVEVYNGASWISVANYTNAGGNIPWTSGFFNVTAYKNTNFQVRFRAYGIDSYNIDWWYIDNIHIWEPAATPIVTVTPPSPFDFSNVQLGNTKNQIFTVTNTGGGTVTITGFGLVSTDFSIVASTTGTLPPGPVSVEVQFAPTSTGSKTATLEIYDNLTDLTTSVTLNGNAIPTILNDDCVDATFINTYPSVQTGTCNGADIDCPGVLDWPAVWYQLDLPYALNNVNINYCGTLNLYTVGIAYYFNCLDCNAYSIVTNYTWPICPGGETASDQNILNVAGPTTIYWPAYVANTLMEGIDFTVTFNVTPVSGPPCGTTNLGAITPTATWQNASYAAGSTYYWNFTGTAGETYNFSNCGAGEDTYLRIYDAAYTEIAYNDDYGVWCTSEMAASLDWICPANGTYYVSLAHYSCVNLYNAWNLAYKIAAPCVVDCPPGGILENEPDILDDQLDVVNGGCNNTPPIFSPIACGETICGNWNTYLFGGLQYRDTDWYLLDLTATTTTTTITWDVTGEFPSQAYILTGVCPTTVLASATAAPCAVASCTYTVGPGIYYLFAGGSVFTGYPAGGDWDYTATVTCVAGPPVPANDNCANAIPVTGPYPVTGIAGTTIGSTLDCAGFLDTPGVWYSIDLPYAFNKVIIDLCATTFDNCYIVIFPDCSCSTPWYADTWTFTPPCVYDLTWNEIVGPTTIYYNVWTGTTTSDFVLDVDVQDLGLPVANITPPSFTVQVDPGASTSDVLNFGNTGTYSLNYTADVVYPAKATAICYPQNVNYWTGSTTTAAKTQVSQINIFAGSEQAWAQFDVSSIPVGATIISASVSWYVNTQNCPYQYINALSVDPVATDPATLYAAITGGALYTDYSQCPPLGWNTIVLGGNANADLTAALGSGKFGVSFYEYEASFYYWTADGWAEVNKPYITVTYTTTPFWLTLDGAQSISGSVIPGGNYPATVGFNSTGLAVGTYTADIVITTNEPGAKASYIRPVNFLVGYGVSGYVYYGTTGTTKPMATNTTVTLNPVGITVPTGPVGDYLIRPVASGAYDLTGATTKPGGGLQAFDATLVARYLGSIVAFTDLQKRAADVNLSNTVTSFDGTLLKRRLGGITTPQWTAPVYVFDGPFPSTPLLSGLPVTVAGASVYQDLRTLCTGDLNSSFAPPAE